MVVNAFNTWMTPSESTVLWIDLISPVIVSPVFFVSSFDDRLELANFRMANPYHVGEIILEKCFIRNCLSGCYCGSCTCGFSIRVSCRGTSQGRMQPSIILLWEQGASLEGTASSQGKYKTTRIKCWKCLHAGINIVHQQLGINMPTITYIPTIYLDV